MPKPVVIVGALDTKGEEFRFARDLSAARGLETIPAENVRISQRVLTEYGEALMTGGAWGHHDHRV